MQDIQPHILVGIDVGGTFTDVFVIDQDTGKASVHKVPSTRGKEADGFFHGLGNGAPDLRAVAAVIHGTTVGTNALLERKGARAGLITTSGFRDILEMRRRDRPTTWGLWGQYEPVIPRSMSRQVEGRILSDGREHVPFDEVGFCAAVDDLIEAGAQSVGVVFINAFANDDHENRARQLLNARWPNAHISISSELLPEIREYERASTTVLNAYLQPPVGDYLATLENRLAENNFGGEFLIVQSNGGLMRAQEAARTPVKTALSGPAAGVYASAYLARGSGFDNIITCDMGGTSFDISLVSDGEAALAAQASVDFGLVIRSPMIEITTIGAGGGSIACVDAGGIIQIGPESAGSVPGPVCYGQGNQRPTVTDANVVLGRINSDSPIGGKLESLDTDAARTAIMDEIGTPLGLDVMQAAEAIIDVANARMAGAIRLVSIERGHDPRSFAAMPFGGGGALHCCALVREINFAGALVPRFPGVVSALGCVIADMRHDFVRTVQEPVSTSDLDQLAVNIAAFEAEGRARLAQSKAQFIDIRTQISLDMLYAGQTHSVIVTLDSALATKLDRNAIKKTFETAYHQAYGQILDAVEPIIVNLRLAVIGERPKFDLSLLAPGDNLTKEDALYGYRSVVFEGKTLNAAIYDRLALPVGAVVSGPAVLEQPDATCWIEPGFLAKVDTIGNLVVTAQTTTGEAP